VLVVSLPSLPEQGLTLESSDPSRGAHEAARVPPLTDRIALGGPVAVAVTPDYVADDPGLRAFVAGEAAHAVYYLVHLSVSFAAEPASPRLDSAALDLTLSGPADAPQPVAWSMSPLRVSDPVQLERRFSLGPELKLADVSVKLGELDRTVSRQREDIFLQAQGELRADPRWEFQHTPAARLYGSFRLIMVVRAATGQPTSLSATIRAATKGNLLRRYRRELTGPLALTAVL
jgi:hypothetical protein